MQPAGDATSSQAHEPVPNTPQFQVESRPTLRGAWRQRVPILGRTNLWLVPTVCVLAALALFVFTQSLDRAGFRHAITLPHWVDQGGASDARDLLSATVGAIITTLGLVLSITVLTLSIAASQFGQRLLRRFMRDRGTQITIGIFSATFVFSLMTLLSVTSRPNEPPYVPWVSCWVSTLLALSCIATLVFFVHHVAQLIQVNTILADISVDLRRVVHQQATQDGRIFSPPQVKQDFLLKAPASGYLRTVDYPALVRAAEKCDAVVQFLCRPGQFVIRGMALAAGGHRGGRAELPDAPAELAQAFGRALVIGPRRTLAQDPEFAIAQIVEIGLRAMSPAVNDPNTMFTCVQWLGDGLQVIAQTPPRRIVHLDANGQARVIELEYPYERFVGAAFDPLRQVARSSPEASVVMLETIVSLAECLTEEKHLAPLAAQADLVREGFDKNATSHDRARVEAAYKRAMGATRARKAA
jgi:uncharacterized membrane protein